MFTVDLEFIKDKNDCGLESIEKLTHEIGEININLTKAILTQSGLERITDVIKSNVDYIDKTGMVDFGLENIKAALPVVVSNNIEPTYESISDIVTKIKDKAKDISKKIIDFLKRLLATIRKFLSKFIKMKSKSVGGGSGSSSKTLPSDAVFEQSVIDNLNNRFNLVTVYMDVKNISDGKEGLFKLLEEVQNVKRNMVKNDRILYNRFIHMVINMDNCILELVDDCVNDRYVVSQNHNALSSSKAFLEDMINEFDFKGLNFISDLTKVIANPYEFSNLTFMDIDFAKGHYIKKSVIINSNFDPDVESDRARAVIRNDVKTPSLRTINVMENLGTINFTVETPNISNNPKRVIFKPLNNNDIEDIKRTFNKYLDNNEKYVNSILDKIEHAIKKLEEVNDSKFNLDGRVGGTCFAVNELLNIRNRFIASIKTLLTSVQTITQDTVNNMTETINYYIEESKKLYK